MNRGLFGLNSNDEGGPNDSTDGSFAEQAAETILARYNSQSELTGQVTAECDYCDFALSTP